MKQLLKRFQKKKKKTGLALGGGAVLGAVHIGVLRALDEYGIRPDCIAGTSIGAFVATLYAFGKTPDEIEEITKKLSWLDVSEISLSRFGLLSNEKMGDLLKQHLGDKNIEDAQIPLRVNTTDITTGERLILSRGNLALAVRASACIPGIFKPVKWEERLLVDGGVMENVPLTALKDMNAGFVIGVELLAHDAKKKPDNILEVLLNTFEFMISNITKSQEKVFDILIRPDLSSFDKVDTGKIPELMLVGYEETQIALNEAGFRPLNKKDL